MKCYSETPEISTIGEQNHSHNAMLDSPKAWPAPVPIPANLPKTSDLTVSKPVWATHLACWMTFKKIYVLMNGYKWATGQP